MKRILGATNILALLTLQSGGSALGQDHIVISSDWGSVTAELAGNAAASALAGMLPLTLEMDDHLRQENRRAAKVIAGRSASARVVQGYARPLEFGRFRHLLS